MTIYAKCFITTLSAMLLVNAPPNNEEGTTAQKTTHDVDRLIDLTKRDIRDLESKIDSILIAKGDTIIIKKLGYGTATTQ